jgi:hypothetical protein
LGGKAHAGGGSCAHGLAARALAGWWLEALNLRYWELGAAGAAALVAAPGFALRHLNLLIRSLDAASST